MTSMDGQVNLQDASAVCALLEQATVANFTCPQRHGSMIDLPAQGQLLISGDLHDHRINFQKILRLAELDRGEDRFLILQELIHSERLINGVDLSYRTLVQGAALTLQYPGRVHVLLANHELAQVNGEDIAKYGISLVQAFNRGLDYVFDELADKVRDAIEQYVRSLPLAVRCGNGVMCSHSLPSQHRRAAFDPMVLTRRPNLADYTAPQGSAYLMVWGRNIAQAWADDLASLWNVEVFVLGHQPAEMGYELGADTMLILASDHEHGCVLPIDLSRHYSRIELVEEILPLAALAGT